MRLVEIFYDNGSVGLFDLTGSVSIPCYFKGSLCPCVFHIIRGVQGGMLSTRRTMPKAEVKLS